MSYKFWIKFDIHGGGVIAFLIALIITFSLANKVTFANEESDTHNKSGDAHFHVADYTKALEEYTAAINIDNKVARYFSNRAWTYIHLKNYDAAKKDFDTAIQIDEKLSNAYRGRAELYRIQGNLEESKKDFTKAGSLYYETGNYSEGAEDFTKAIEIDSENSGYYTKRGWDYFKLKKYVEAENDFDKALRLSDDNNAYAYEGRAQVYKETEKFEDAKNDFCNAIEEYYNNADYDSAKAVLKTVMALDNSYARALYWAGMIEHNVDKNYKKAVEYYTTLIDNLKNPYKPEVIYCNRGEGYLLQHDYDAAINDFSKAIDIDPTYIGAYKRRAEIYFYHKKDYSSAFADYKEALRFDKNQKILSYEEKEIFEKNTKVCWDAFNFLERFKMKLRYPEYKLYGLLGALFVVIVVDYILGLVGDLRDPQVHLTFGLALQKLVAKMLLLLFTDIVGVFDKSQLVAFSIRDIILTLAILYELLYTLNDATRAGIPIPNWLSDLVKKVINMFEGIFQRAPSR